jgi:16S rRNA (cytosine967-C5)-methyltransferase
LLRCFARTGVGPDLACFCELGLAQLLFFDRIPDHAAVSETVHLVNAKLGPSKARFANAFLRSVGRARRQGHSGDPRADIPGRDACFDRPVFRDPQAHPLLWAEDALSMPAVLMKRWSKRLGFERACELARCGLSQPRLSLRATAPGQREEIARRLSELGVSTEPGIHESLLLAAPEHSERVLSSADFRAGRLTVQGETALRAAELMQPRPGERLLDVCAPPGGKTAVLAETGARVVALSTSEAQERRLRSTTSRLHLCERVEMRILEGGEGELKRLGTFPGVLVDAPCSNTGVLAQRPHARWRYSPSAARSLHALQRELLWQSSECVERGGRLVWSTCSIESDENAQLVREFLAHHGSWQLEQEHEALPTDATGGPIDGGYAARLRRA